MNIIFQPQKIARYGTTNNNNNNNNNYTFIERDQTGARQKKEISASYINHVK